MSVPMFRSDCHLTRTERESRNKDNGGGRNIGTGRAAQHIEDALTWAYRDQRVDAPSSLSAGLHVIENEADGRVWYGSSADGIAAIERIGALGCRVDSSGFASAAASDGDADAVALYEAVERLDRRRRDLVTRHARAGTEPAWLVADTPRPAPRYEGAGGKVLVLPTELGRVCPLVWLGGEIALATARSDYRAWHAGLVEIAQDLAGRVPGAGGVRFAVLAPAAPAMPWAAERAVEPERCGRRSALTPEQVEEIRAARQNGRASIRQLAARYGVGKSTIERVC